MVNETGSQDTAWKDIIREFLPDFLTFYFPTVATKLKLSVQPMFRDKELSRIARGHLISGRIADLLVDLPKAGATAPSQPILVLCHVEVQGTPEADFTDRLFQYAYRIYDRFGRFPVTLVVLTDNDARFHPTAFTRDLLGVSLRLEFHVAKLLDYKERVKRRRSGDNIFAAVTRLHLAVQRERPRRRYRDNTFRFELKRRLMREVVEARPPQPDEEQRILRLLAFLDWLVALPTELESLFFDETESARGADVMPYVTSWERMGIKKGLEQGQRGREQGLQLGELREKHTVLKRLFDRKFGLQTGRRGAYRRNR